MRRMVAAAVLSLVAVSAVYAGQPEGGLLIIAVDSFVDIVEPLAEWKRQKGLFTSVISLHDIDPDTTPDTTEIRACISDVADTMQVGLSYVLLVGRSSLLPGYRDGPSEVWTDCRYGDLASGYPMEIPVGRLPAGDLHQCSTLVEKVLQYERPSLGSDSLWYKKGCTIVRDFQDDDSTRYYNDSRVAHEHWKEDSFVAIDSLRALADDSSRHVTVAINDGRCFVTYRGVAVSEWRDPFNEIVAGDLTNGAKMPVVVSGSCETMVLHYLEESMYGDQFMCAGSPDSLGGAVAYFGTTESGSGIALPRSTCFRGFLHGVYEDEEFRIGDATLRARHWVDSLQQGRTRYLEWNLFGDPTMHVWTGGVPKSPTVQVRDSIPSDADTLAIVVSVGAVPVENALVCLWNGLDLHVAARTDTSGVATCTLGLHEAGWVAVTVSEGRMRDALGQPVLPHVDSVWSLGHYGWVEVEPMPDEPTEKTVGRGGWLTYSDSLCRVLAAKGHRTTDFYAYYPEQDRWEQLLAMPYEMGPWPKIPYKGGRGITNGAGTAFILQGNNTLGFWTYSILGDCWDVAPDVPHRGPRVLRVKRGADLEYVERNDTAYVFLLKGIKSEFYRYVIPPGSSAKFGRWDTLADAPHGRRDRWNDGSWLVASGDSVVYALKARYNELWKYDIASDSWVAQCADLPFYGRSGARRKTKDGGAGCLLNGRIYAVKGGNTGEMWQYVPSADSWYELTDMPMMGSSGRRRGVRWGGDLVCAGSRLVALKGSHTRENWHFAPEPNDMPIWRPAGVSVAGGFGEETVSEGQDAECARWNDNGEYICYFKEDTATWYNQIFMKEYDSQEPEVQLTDIETDCEQPVFSPQGGWIAFQMDDTVNGYWQICRVRTTESDADGTGGGESKGVVSTSGAPNTVGLGSSVEVSPVLQAPPVVSSFEYEMEQLTSAEYDHENPEYSPDGTMLAFCRDDDDGYYQICVMSAEGGAVTQLTTGNADHEWPVWLDNNTIVYEVSEDEEWSVPGLMDRRLGVCNVRLEVTREYGETAAQGLYA